MIVRNCIDQTGWLTFRQASSWCAISIIRCNIVHNGLNKLNYNIVFVIITRHIKGILTSSFRQYSLDIRSETKSGTEQLQFIVCVEAQCNVDGTDLYQMTWGRTKLRRGKRRLYDDLQRYCMEWPCMWLDFTSVLWNRF